MSATDTSQPTSDFLKSPRLSGDFELNSWTQGLGGAPRPNPLPSSSTASQPSNPPAQNPHSPLMGVNPSNLNPLGTHRYTQPNPSMPNSNTPNPSMRYDSKLSSSSQTNPSNPFISTPALGQGAENRPETRANLREAWSQAQTSDLQSFDLSTYVQTQPRPSAMSASRDHSPPKMDQPLSASGSGFNDWGHQSGVSQDHTLRQTAFDQLSVADSGSNANEFEEYDADGGNESYESRFANKKILLSTILLGAVVLGGGISYLYSSFFGQGTEGPTPVVKNDQGPSKVKPTDPGGKQFAHSDSKILGRLTDENTPSEANPSPEARKVSTLVVGRDGAIQSPAPSDPQNASPSVSVPVPGLTLIDGPASNGKPSSENIPTSVASSPKPENLSSESVKSTDTNAAPKSSPTDTVSQAAASSTSANTAPSSTTPSPSSASNKSSEPSLQAKAESGTSSSSTEASSKSTLTEADQAQPSTQKKVASGATSATVPVGTSTNAKSNTEIKTAALEPAPKASRPQTGQATGMGYVPVLASVPVSANSRIVALQQYADLQQKYNAILQNKTPDVQVANLGEKGRYHRLIIGPPSSKEAANAICAQLKTAGYSACWIMAY